ncbi:GNAT family N-acetyltransferase [Robertkochia flava]|uniref:GNAT family N-acetyltransferase n=1 Tax=Robertkochia flava TaxID=3447986 RepID=UPI001CCC060A|nr:GNAT family N-acetyltransferase [Robertkochia marina]
MMTFREAALTDIPQMHVLRNQVRENILTDPARVTETDYRSYLGKLGKGWVCEEAQRIVGFAIADLKANNVWALFVHPEFEGKGIGKKLQDIMLSWYFSRTTDPIWLSTGANTRAEEFYTRTGWEKLGNTREGEVKFEMSFENWKNR